MRKHTTHFDDCGCISEKKDQRIQELKRVLKRLSDAIDSTTYFNHGELYCRYREETDLVELRKAWKNAEEKLNVVLA